MKLASVALVLVAQSAFAAVSLEDELKTEFARYTEASRTFDTKTMDKMFHKDYIEVSPLGDVDLRDRVIGFYVEPKNRRVVPKSVLLDDWHFRFPQKNSAITIVRERFTLESQGKEMTITMRSTVTWLKVGREWKMTSQHVVGMR